MEVASEFVYKIPGRSGSSKPGAHRSPARGPGMAFSGYVRLLDQPDPRRLDLRASLRNLQGDWLVRATRQTSATVVQVMMDISASMHFGVPQKKLDVAAQFMEALGQSAFGYGDALGMHVFDSEPRPDLSATPRTGRGVGSSIAASLRQWPAFRANAGSTQTMNPHTLAASAMNLGHGTTLVFMVSDFHFPLEFLHDALDQLSHVTVVPIVIWSQAETQPPPAGRWIRSRDVETGKLHNLIMRKSTIKRWQENITLRRSAILDVFEPHGITPLFMDKGFSADALSRYFMETAL